MSELALEVSDLSKRYRERQAVDRLAFTVGPGEIFGLLGPNGAGKTTTLSMLSTLLVPDGGQVRIAGFDLFREPNRIRGIIGLVPQDIALYGRLSAAENLHFFGRMYGLGGRLLRHRAEEALEAVGLADRRRDPVRTFSGGMKRRLNIAAALLHRPKLLFLDEPTVGIDPQSRNFIFELVERLRDERSAILYTTHYMEEAERLCDRVAIMDEGRLLALDSPGALIESLGGGLIRAGLASEPTPDFSEAVAALPHVDHLGERGGLLEITAADLRAALVELVQLTQARDLELGSIEVHHPDLEAVFLRLTGKRLRD